MVAAKKGLQTDSAKATPAAQAFQGSEVPVHKHSHTELDTALWSWSLWW